MRDRPDRPAELLGREWRTCAIEVGQQLWCWGENLFGQTGDGSAWDAQLTPVR
ncbi:MAG: hypothetical protein M3680_11550 [Myxococcota bacterium]|nr:hypothetical protein [Myxococcota bacterium]